MNRVLHPPGKQAWDVLLGGIQKTLIKNKFSKGGWK